MVTKGVAGQTAVVWIIRNQFGRRNLSNYTRVELVLKLEPLLRVKAKENQRAGGQSSEVGRQKSDKPLDTKRDLAKAAGVSHDTIAKGKVIAAKASEETKARFLAPSCPVVAFEWAGWCPDMGAKPRFTGAAKSPLPAWQRAGLLYAVAATGIGRTLPGASAGFTSNQRCASAGFTSSR